MTQVGNATLTNVASAITNATLLAANSKRLGVIIENDSASVLYVKFGATAAATSFTIKMAAGARFEMLHVIYNGRIDGIWVTADGAARITELT